MNGSHSKHYRKTRDVRPSHSERLLTVPARGDDHWVIQQRPHPSKWLVPDSYIFIILSMLIIIVLIRPPTAKAQSERILIPGIIPIIIIVENHQFYQIN